MKRNFYMLCAISGTLVGILLVCGGISPCLVEYGLGGQLGCDTVDRFLGPTRGSSPFHTPAGADDPARTRAIYPALSLLWAAESSNGKQMVGDGGLAIGHFQQHEGHWRDGCESLDVSWPYTDRYILARASAVTAANWARYALQDVLQGDVEMLIRRHRLPNDPMRPSNDAYLARVKGVEP